MPFVDNTPKPAPPSTVGFKLSKPGYNAMTTAANNMIFDSNWPSLPIAFSKTFDSPFTGGGVTTYTLAHNLKFAPLCFIWAYGPDPSGVGNTCWRFLQKVDTTNVYFDTNTLNLPQQAFVNAATKIHVKCFQLDLSYDVDYTLAPGDTFQSPYDPNFGIKVALPFKDTNSRDMRDFALHSRCQSPLIMAVKTQATSSPSNPTTVQFTSKYKFPVWVYGFIKNSNGRYQPAPYYAQAYPKTVTDGFVSNITYVGPDVGATLVILRDPMFAPTLRTVTY